MPTRTLEIDLRQGTGAESEPMYGVVTVQRAKAKTTGGFEILPFETTLKLINGKATITEAETDGTGPFYDSVYLFRVQNGYCGHRYGFMAALPDGTTPITTGELPMVDPITGEGIYMDAQEWNALYGDLPDRVSSLETGKANTSHTHVIGDVTGLQTALNTKGNTTMRVDTTVGTRVFISDGVTERMIHGDTGWRLIQLKTGWSGILKVKRVMNTIYWSGALTMPSTGIIMGDVPSEGFAILAGTTPNLLGRNSDSGAVNAITVGGVLAWAGTLVAGQRLRFEGSYETESAWPTTLPGTPA